MLRAEVEEHVAASGAVHLRRAWEKVTEQGSVIMKQQEEIVGLQRRADALTRVFTWSTDSELSDGQSDSYTFTEGVVGCCYNEENDNFDDDETGSTYDDDGPDGDERRFIGTHFMAFMLCEAGPAYTVHCKCSILDKNDKVLRVSRNPPDYDFQKPALTTTDTAGFYFSLTDADKAGAVRADGSIKLRMVVHLYLPE